MLKPITFTFPLEKLCGGNLSFHHSFNGFSWKLVLRSWVVPVFAAKYAFSIISITCLACSPEITGSLSLRMQSTRCIMSEYMCASGSFVWTPETYGSLRGNSSMRCRSLSLRLQTSTRAYSSFNAPSLPATWRPAKGSPAPEPECIHYLLFQTTDDGGCTHSVTTSPGRGQLRPAR